MRYSEVKECALMPVVMPLRSSNQWLAYVAVIFRGNQLRFQRDAFFWDESDSDLSEGGYAHSVWSRTAPFVFELPNTYLSRSRAKHAATTYCQRITQDNLVLPTSRYREEIYKGYVLIGVALLDTVDSVWRGCPAIEQRVNKKVIARQEFWSESSLIFANSLSTEDAAINFAIEVGKSRIQNGVQRLKRL